MEPSQSQADTRDSRCAGMRCAIAVSHQTPNNPMPTPAAAMAAYSTASGGPTAYRVIAPGQDNPASIPARTGRWGRHHEPTTAPAAVPTPQAALVRPKAAAPPTPSTSAVASAGLANEATSRLTPPRA